MIWNEKFIYEQYFPIYGISIKKLFAFDIIIGLSIMSLLRIVSDLIMQWTVETICKIIVCNNKNKEFVSIVPYSMM